MRSIILAATILILPAIAMSAETFYVLKDGVYTKVLDFPPGSEIVVGDSPIPPTNPSGLEQKVRAAATLIGEPTVSSTIGDGYEFGRKRMAEGQAWDSAIKATESFRALAASGGKKQVQWSAMFVQLDVLIAASPKTAATLDAIAKGFKSAAQAGGDEKLNFDVSKLIECLPCIFAAFLSAEDQAALKIEIDAVEEGDAPTLAPVPVPNGHIKYPFNDVPATKSVSVLKPYVPVPGSLSLDDAMAGKIGHWTSRTPAARASWLAEFNKRGTSW